MHTSLLGLGIICSQLLGFAINEAQLPNLQLHASYPVIQPSLVLCSIMNKYPWKLIILNYQQIESCANHYGQIKEY